MMIVGGIFLAIGLISFFSAFGGMGMPKYFWCAFVGMPLLGIGGAITKFAYMGAISRYVASEVAPVGVDVVNYTVDGTRDSIRDVASSIGAGLRGETDDESLRCSQCGERNDADAKFCDECGTALASTVACQSCLEANDIDSKFCKSCGTRMA